MPTITPLPPIPDHDHKTSTGSLLIPDPNNLPINPSTSDLLNVDHMLTRPPTTSDHNHCHL
ncbi:unnamed protein product [Brassica oleracea var. botrytis]|uniref:Uncharacterized protein n=2 Tax=Brassica TaxID=3705 RepID=A0ABQ7YCH3_BRANA|nr:hypothetical protein HID58_083076 [Brassica napus]VDD58440.1 unnamed protein product [Brassica oleracea]